MKLLNAGQSPFGFHRLLSFMQCPTKYYRSYVSDEDRPKTDSPSLIIGSLVHTGLAHRYALIKASQDGQSSDLFDPVSAMREQANTESGEWLNWIEKAERVYSQYDSAESTKEFESNIKVVAVEEVYEIKIEQFTLTFRADLVIEKDGLVYFVDHKTCAYIKSVSTDGYQASGQFLAYISYGRQGFENFGGMLLNYIATGGQRSEKFDTAILEVQASEDHLSNFGNSVYFYFKMINALDGKAGKFYPRVQSEFTCTHKYGKCQYYDRCFGSTKQNTNLTGDNNNE
jgi:hypothetical protein